MKRLAILGSTGSIGTQTLDVVRMHSDQFEVEVLVANRNVELLVAQAREFHPNAVVIADEACYPALKEALADEPIKVYAGAKSVEQIVGMSTIDIVLVALVGFSGLRPTLAAIEAGKTIALANKETLVVGGEIVMAAAARKKVNILPVDSEHSAIFQCLNGERHLKPKRLILTASGGPFRGWTHEQLQNVKPQDALKNPNWQMGAKVTIDSASLMNKGLELIEARWLFDVAPDDIDIVVHPQSIVHSMVEFADGSVKAQLATPDMRLPIQYALTFPQRTTSPIEPLNFLQFNTLTFEEPNKTLFRNLPIAIESIKRGGNAPCVMNGANEVAVAEFLSGKINFLQMPDIIEETLAKCNFVKQPSLDDYFASDNEARRVAKEAISKL